MALDENLAALLTVEVNYYAKTGLDKHGQDTWETDPTVLYCYPAYGGRMVQQKDGTLYTSEQVLYFDANDTTVQGFQLGDRFQSVGIAGGQTMEAVAIEPEYSPGPDLAEPMTPWLIEVTL